MDAYPLIHPGGGCRIHIRAGGSRNLTHEQPPKAAAAEARQDVSTAGRLKDDSAKAASSDTAEVQDAAVRCHANLTLLLSETLHILRLDAWIPANNKVQRGFRMQYE